MKPKKRNPVRRLSAAEYEELCDLFAKCGAGDLLDFIHWCQYTARENDWSLATVLEIVRRSPPEPIRTPADLVKRRPPK